MSWDLDVDYQRAHYHEPHDQPNWKTIVKVFVLTLLISGGIYLTCHLILSGTTPTTNNIERLPDDDLNASAAASSVVL